MNLKQLINLSFFLVLAVLSASTLHAYVEEGRAENIPWSGWFWPTNAGGLATGVGYRGTPSPLQKYDMFTSGSINGPATSYYLEHHYDPNAPGWYGLCDAWAAASILEPIAFAPSSINNLYFFIGDKKGLVTAGHDLDFTDVDFEPMDSPLVLHTWLQTYIRDRKEAFFAELDPGEEIWNFPIYQYRMEILDYGDQDYVTCKIWYADDDVDPDVSGTIEKTKTYQYTLFKGGSSYTGGEWRYPNTFDHPEKVMYPRSQMSKNPYLDYEIIKKIAGSKDDSIEANLSVSISPGGYNLILMNQDSYLLQSDSSDELVVSFKKVDQTDELMDVFITDATGNEVYRSNVTENVSTLALDSRTGPYTLVFEKNKYDNPGMYRLEYDIKKNFEYVKPQVQKGFGWGGYTIVNASGVECEDIIVSGFAKDGTPVDTYLGPFSLASGEKKTILTSDFPHRNMLEKQDFYSVKISAPQHLDVVNLSGGYEDNMAFFSREPRSDKLIIPYLPNLYDYSQSISWGVYNSDVRAAEVLMTLYAADGSLVEQKTFIIPGRNMRQYSTMDSPFEKEDSGGWVCVESQNDLVGYAERVSRSSDFNEVLSALIPGKSFLIANPVATGGWDTDIAFINVSEQPASLSLSLWNNIQVDGASLELAPFEKREINIRDLFPDLTLSLISSSFMKIVSDNEIAGFYRYRTDNADEVMALPFSSMDEVKKKFVVPHIAADDVWWTGINLCNSGNETAEIKFLPYDITGRKMEDSSVVVNIYPETKFVSDAAQLFKASAGEIAFIGIEIQKGPGVAGAYGYGNIKMSMLAGAKLK